MPSVGKVETISGDELRERVDKLGLGSVAQAADKLGLTRDGLAKAMNGQRRVGRQTQIIIGLLEAMQNAPDAAPPGRHPRQRRRTA
jgi:hypothetical protein